MSILLCVLHELWSIIDDSGSVVSSVVSSHPVLFSFHMLAGNLDRAPRRPKGWHHTFGKEPQALHGLLVPIGGRIVEQERGQAGLVAQRAEPGGHGLGGAVHEGRRGEGV